MKSTILKSIAICILPLLASWVTTTSTKETSNESTATTYKTKHHIILVVDGPRWSETWGDPNKRLIPNQATILKAQGVFFNNFSNQGQTYTNSSHAALLTGRYQNISNQGKQLPRNPNIMQYYLKQYGKDKRDAWVMTSKGKLEMLANTKNKHYWNQFMPSTYCGWKGSGKGFPNDREMVPTFKRLLLDNRPTITIINLLDIDSWAHQGNWDRYIAAIQELDGLVLDLWNTIQSDPEMKDQTAIYITNDHGRHLDGVKKGFESHGCKCAGCKKISLLAIGPDFPKGTEVDTPYDLIDIPATIAYMLNIDMPTSKGDVIKELTAPQR